ncbi:MAG: 7-carboxy-7-deazaguanine synthase, partial [Gemmatimonadales bacterium]
MSYAVKEIYYTLQGEGMRAGRPAVFCRFAGCNLWSGREADRRSAVCRFCDTDFVGTGGPGGGKFATATELANQVAAMWPRSEYAAEVRYVVCTGGEPTLQLDVALITALHDRGFEIAVESNGTIPMPPVVDWTCISPKAGTTLEQIAGDELKLVYPQPGAEPERYVDLDF